MIAAGLRQRELAAERQRLRRERQKAGVVIVSVEVSFGTQDALADAGLVEWDTTDRAAIGKAATVALNEWAVTRDGLNAADMVQSEHDG